MRLFKNVLIVLIIGLLIFNLFSFFYMRSIRIFGPQFSQDINTANISSYVSLLQFYPNMRFSHNNLTFNLEDNCNFYKREKMAFAFSKIEKETNNLLNFHKTEINPDILVTCNETYSRKPKSDFYIAGEGGPEKAVKSGNYYVIEHGTVLLYYTSEKDCLNYNVELHELLHVLGFIHSDNKYSVMHNISECYQILTKDIIDEIVRLYSIPSYPDVMIESITALKHGIYLDFEIEVGNVGLKKAGNIILEVSSRGESIESFNLEELDYGERKILSVKNLKIPIVLLNLDELTFSLSTEESELDYNNNNITLTLSK